MVQQENWSQQVWGGVNPTTPPAQPTAAPEAYGVNPQAAAYYPPPMTPPPSYPPPSQPDPAPKRGWIVALVAVILFFAVIFFGITSCTGMVDSSMNSLGLLGGQDELVATQGNTIGIIDMGGTIQYDGTVCSPEGLRNQLDIAESNPDIKAVVLRVNSGGGTATAGEEMAGYIRDFSKPVVVSSASLNASAAYEISSQADYIYTAKTTAIGAIGTVMQITDLSGLMNMLGIRVDNITSADSKDSSYGVRPLTEEERAYYQAQVDQINHTFIETVAQGRGMTFDQVSALATGLTFTGIDAVSNGLADEIGSLEDAVAKAMELSGVDTANTIYLRPASSGFSVLDLLSSQNQGNADLTALLEELKEAAPAQ